MMGLRRSFLLLLVSATLAPALACVGNTHVEGGLPDRDPELAYRLVKSEGAILLDVRTPQEFAQDGLRGAKNIPIDQLGSRLSDLEKWTNGDKSKPIVVYCTVGVRAAQAKRLLLGAGYSSVSNLGGVRDWPRRP